MANYYYSGRTPVPIPVGHGEVKAVRPYSHVEIDNSVIGDSCVSRLMGRGVLRLTGRPAGATQVLAVVENTKLPPGPKDEFSKAIVSESKGVGPGIPVKSGPPANADVKPSDSVPRRKRVRRRKPDST